MIRCFYFIFISSCCLLNIDYLGELGTYFERVVYVGYHKMIARTSPYE